MNTKWKSLSCQGSLPVSTRSYSSLTTFHNHSVDSFQPIQANKYSTSDIFPSSSSILYYHTVLCPHCFHQIAMMSE